MDSVPQWFSGVEMNFAENILFSQDKGTKGGLSTVGKEDYKVAVTEVREGVTEIRHVTWGELRKGVGRLEQAMRAAGVKRGDRIAGMLVICVVQSRLSTPQFSIPQGSLGDVLHSWEFRKPAFEVEGVTSLLIQHLQLSWYP
jgi:hypothetical protein